MKILGIGVDIIENKRFSKLIKNKKFISRVFSNKEIILSKRKKNKTNYFAKRFAAKEAFSKSIGTGFRDNLNLKDISILNDNSGRPYYVLNNKLKNKINLYFNIKKFKTFLSLSDENKHSIAFSIIQK
tara:strand:+ start:1272 stop:1655 length:384 start_codon:yes stop_codon:yes gene_type:complete